MGVPPAYKGKGMKKPNLFHVCINVVPHCPQYNGAEHQLPQYIKTFKKREETKESCKQ